MMEFCLINLARLIIGGIVVALTACASSITGPTDYPASWASIASSPTADGCPNLTAIYSNRPSGAVPGEVGDAPSLTEVFMRMAYGPGPRGTVKLGRSQAMRFPSPSSRRPKSSL